MGSITVERVGRLLDEYRVGGLAVVAVDYFFNPPVGAFEVSVDNAASAFVFVMVALLISWIDAAYKRALRERDRLLI